MPGSRRLTATNGASAGVLPALVATPEDYAGDVPPLPSPDPAGDAAGTRPTPSQGTHDERLRVPAWWWLLGVALIALLGYEVQLALHQSSLSWIAYAVLTPLVFWGLWSMGRTRVRVADGELWAHNAHLPIEVIDRAAVIPAAAKSAALGRQLDPAAFLVHKFWVKTMVLLVLDDPDDPTPYWLVSTRHPEKLVAALGLPDAATEASDPG